MKLANNIPIKANIIIRIILPRMVCFFDNSSILSGKREKIDTDAITPAAKEIAPLVILSVFLNLKKIGIVPSMVDNPATVVTKNENVILFILNCIILIKKYDCY